jgi:hypothetical protein
LSGTAVTLDSGDPGVPMADKYTHVPVDG